MFWLRCAFCVATTPFIFEFLHVFLYFKEVQCVCPRPFSPYWLVTPHPWSIMTSALSMESPPFHPRNGGGTVSTSSSYGSPMTSHKNNRSGASSPLSHGSGDGYSNAVPTHSFQTPSGYVLHFLCLPSCLDVCLGMSNMDCRTTTIDDMLRSIRLQLVPNKRHYL